ncbi:DHHC-like palmitoyl transferase [Cryptosporidium canis]|nr:DHHC-like palmitoyl transferase [Cryptosporidium canis]
MNQKKFKSIYKQSPIALTFIIITSIKCFTIYNLINFIKLEQSTLCYYLCNIILTGYIILFILLQSSFLMLSIVDPGSLESLNCSVNVPNGFKSTIRYCNKCIGNKWKPPRAHHCTMCNICIFRMDHHCILVNNCIGYSNQKIYILFLFYSLCSTIFTVAISLLLTYKLKLSSNASVHKITTALIINSIVNIIIFLTAAVFFSDQIDYITSNSSLVELLSNRRGRNTEFINNFKVIFGENKLLWFLPTKNSANPDFCEELYEIIDYPKSQILSEIRHADSIDQFKSKLTNIDQKPLKNE